MWRKYKGRMNVMVAGHSSSLSKACDNTRWIAKTTILSSLCCDETHIDLYVKIRRPVLLKENSLE